MSEQLSLIRGLKSLVLWNVRVPSLPGSLRTLCELAILVVVNCGLRSLPVELFELQSLVLLDVRKNMLSSLSPGHCDTSSMELPSLQVLVFENNRVKVLPAWVANSIHLQELKGSQNIIQGGCEQLQGLTKLRVISLSGNKLTSLGSLAGCLELESLDISENRRLSYFPVIRTSHGGDKVGQIKSCVTNH